MLTSLCGLSTDDSTVCHLCDSLRCWLLLYSCVVLQDDVEAIIDEILQVAYEILQAERVCCLTLPTVIVLVTVLFVVRVRHSFICRLHFWLSVVASSSVSGLRMVENVGVFADGAVLRGHHSSRPVLRGLARRPGLLAAAYQRCASVCVGVICFFEMHAACCSMLFDLVEFFWLDVLLPCHD